MLRAAIVVTGTCGAVGCGGSVGGSTEAGGPPLVDAGSKGKDAEPDVARAPDAFVSVVDDGGLTGSQGGASCPATVFLDFPLIACTNQRAVCDYHGATCYCTMSRGGVPTGGAPSWDCVPLNPGCPSPPPPVGGACAPSGQTCDYGSCLGGIAVTCDGGIWAQDDVPCPL